MSQPSSSPASGHDFTVLARHVIEEALGEKWRVRKADSRQVRPHGRRQDFSADSQRAAIHALLQHNSIGAIVRLTGAPKHRIKPLIKTLGEACSGFQLATFRGFEADCVELRQVFTLREKDKKRTTDKPSADEAWTYLAFDRSTFLVPRWIVGPHRLNFVDMFALDTGAMDRTASGMSSKLAICPLWFAGLNPGFAENHESRCGAGRALHASQLGKVRRDLGTTPAMAAGIADRRWTINDILRLLESSFADSTGESGRTD